MHIQRHKQTSTQSTHKRNGDNQAQEPGWEGRMKGFVRDLGHTKKKCQKKPIFTNLKKRFEHVELPAKLLDYLYEVTKATSINQKEERKAEYPPKNERKSTRCGSAITGGNSAGQFLGFQVDRRKPHPPGEVFYLASSLSKNPEGQDPPRTIFTGCFGGGPLWLGDLPNKKPLGEEGVSRIKLISRVRTTRLVEWLSWVFRPKVRKKE